MNNAVSCIYRVGARSVLPHNWQGHHLSLPDSKFYFIEKGSIVLEIYQQTYIAGPGDLLLIPAHTVHSCWMTADLYAEKSWCHFNLKNGASDFFENCTIPPLLHVEDRTVVENLFQLLFSSHDMPAPQNNLTAATAICSLVQYYFNHSAVERREISADRIRQVARYIDRHYAEAITLEQLAQLANYSTSHLTKCFRDTTGVSPIRYLNNVRIEHAKYLLQYSRDSIGSVMERCGFSDASYFSRCFKRSLGYSPQGFRELYRAALPAAEK